MPVSLKPLSDQTLVITGATSGIGLVTARTAAEQGARVVLAARNEEALSDIVGEIEATGGRAAYAVADVGRENEVRHIAEVAVDRFGGIDTWVNNAAVSIYGSIMDIDLDEQRRLFETNYWGVVYGSRVAVEHLRDRGGALINLGSVLADRAIPKQGPYCASKHAIKGFTDSLRMEIEEEDWPISVTLIKPTAIDTPYKDHAKNYLPKAPKNPAPVYAPDTVARAILHCAQHRKRSVIIGGAGKGISVLGTQFPRLTDLVMERLMSRLQMTEEPAGDRDRHNLFEPLEGGKERGGYPNHVSESSLYTQAVLHPWTSAVALLGAGAAAALWVAARSSSSP